MIKFVIGISTSKNTFVVSNCDKTSYSLITITSAIIKHLIYKGISKSDLDFCIKYARKDNDV